MCGIWFYLRKNNAVQNGSLYSAFNNIQHRGPDRHVFEDTGSVVLGFHRLAIMDTSVEGDQPFTFIDGDTKTYVMCNGEIYNHKKLIKQFDLDVRSKSDCEVLPLLYRKLKTTSDMPFFDMLKLLEGCEFAIIIVEITGDKVFVQYARDHFGVRPMYVGEDANGFVLSSELKGTYIDKNSPLVSGARQVEPRNLYSYSYDAVKGLSKLTKTQYWNFPTKILITDEDEAVQKIGECLIECIRDRLDAHRGIVFLCSGGVDSSGICGVAASISDKPLTTRCMGLEGSTDEKYAYVVRDFIKSNHYHTKETEDNLCRVLDRVPYIIESWDTTTNRAGAVQTRVGEEISRTSNDKVVIVGEGADELFGSYSYCANAPDYKALDKEVRELLSNIHYYDGERADRCLSYFGLECRTPFLDSRFVSLVLSIDPKLRYPKFGVEKWLLRRALEPYLPPEVYTRPKEAQSDGCSSQKRSWFEIIDDNIKDIKLDPVEYKNAPPRTKQDLYFMNKFKEAYGDNFGVVPKRWMPKWCGNDVIDPSARVLNTYKYHE